MKKGFTLIELLVYMAVISIVVLVAGQALVDSSKFNSRTRLMVTAAQVANNVSSLLKEDIAQMGVKSWEKDSTLSVGGASTTVAWFHVDSTVYMDVSAADATAHDSSSYELKRGDGGKNDTLIFRKIAYNPKGEYVGVQEIKWYLRESWNKDLPSLTRHCKTISGTGFDDCPKDEYGLNVIIAENVEEFSVVPSIPGPASLSGSSSSVSEDGLIFPEPESSSSSGTRIRLLPRSGACDGFECVGSVVHGEDFSYEKLTNFQTNFDLSAAATQSRSEFYVAEASYDAATWSSNCYEFTFKPREVYSFEFDMDLGDETNNIRMFQPGKDYFSFGLRKKSDGSRIAGISDFVIYPPGSMEAAVMRYNKFSVAGSSDVKACLAFTLALYSPRTAMGSFITLKNFKVFRSLSDVYHFPSEANFYTYNTDPADVNAKKRVKAFKVRALIDESGEKSLVETEIPVPSNGARATATK